MKGRIHRGAREIGGNCVELEQSGARILLDLGLPLWADGPADTPLPAVPGLESGGLAGIVLSHSHLDHCGLVGHAHANTPIFLGAGARRMLEAAADFTGRGLPVGRARTYADREPFEIGPFRVTPYLNDHTAYDGYSFLVEAGGRRLFYSGDFRAHGRTAYRFRRLLADPPRGVDVLLLEGTSLGRAAGPSCSESALEDAVLPEFGEAGGLVLACFSGQNVDRIVTLFKAARRARRTLVLDAYTAHLLGALPERTLPKAHWEGIGVYLSRRWKASIVHRRRFDLIRPFQASRVYLEDLAAAPGRYVLQCRPTMLDDLATPGLLAGARLVYSLWPGYLADPRDPTKSWCFERDIPILHRHTSGHADVADLQRFVAALVPGRVIPIHTAAPGRYAELFPSAQMAADGEWWAV